MNYPFKSNPNLNHNPNPNAKTNLNTNHDLNVNLNLNPMGRDKGDDWPFGGGGALYVET